MPADLADLLRMSRLPEAWIAPAEVRARSELVRHRHKLVQLSASIKAPVHEVLAKCGITVTVSDLFGVAGSTQRRQLALPEVFRARVDSQLRVFEALESEINRFDKMIRTQLCGDTGYRVIQQLGGVGPILAAVFVAELGEVNRFADARRVCSWAGLTPRHRESDTTVHRGSITKQGSKLVRWAAIEAVQRCPKNSPMRTSYDRIVERRGGTGKNLAKVAAARKLLTLVYYGLRDGQIRCLSARAT
jgi:transposase